MPQFRHPVPVLSFGAESANKTSAEFQILPGEDDKEIDAQTQWSVVFDVQQAGGASGPTTDAVLETSVDRQRWVPVASMTQLTANGWRTERKDASALLTYVRARTTVGGGTPPDHNGKIWLCATAPFQLRYLG